MADEPKAGDGKTGGPAADANAPAGKSEQVAPVRDPEAVLAHNGELQKELKSIKAKLRQFEDAENARAEAKKKDEGKFQELLSEKDAALAKSADILKRKEVALLMQRYGLIDPEYASILTGKIEFGEDFEAQNADEVFAELKKSKPYLFGEPASTKRAPGTSSAQAAVSVKAGHVFTRAEIMALTRMGEKGRAILRENKEEIDRQWKDPSSALSRGL